MVAGADQPVDERVEGDVAAVDACVRAQDRVEGRRVTRVAR
jgi:hypothetical protein